MKLQPLAMFPLTGPVASDLGFDRSSLHFDRSTFGSSDPDLSATLE